MAEPRTYTVFEIVNEKRHEIYVGYTGDPIFQMTAALRRRPPKTIKDWDFDDVEAIRSIEFHMSEKDALAFIANYVKTGLPEDWRYLTERSGADRPPRL